MHDVQCAVPEVEYERVHIVARLEFHADQALL
jgi:hypothetical protein